MSPFDQLEVAEKVARTMPEPEWYRRLRVDDGIPLPPAPEEGWGRWWDRYGDIIWLLLIAAGLDLLVTALTREPKE